MPKGLLSNRLNSFQESELAFENSGVGSNGLRSSRIKKSIKKMNVKGDNALSINKAVSNTPDNNNNNNVGKINNDFGIVEQCANPSIGRFGTCGPGASYRVPKKRCSRQATCRKMQQASDTTGNGIEFDAQMNSFNVNVPPRRCCAPSLNLGTSFTNYNN